MFENIRKYAFVTALLVLLTTGFVAAVRPGITIVKDTGLIDGQITQDEQTVTTTTIATITTLAPATQLIGGQTDSHGCLGPAGFTWNETSGKCKRPWSGETQLAAGTILVNMSDPNWRQKINIAVPISDVKCIDSDGGKVFNVAGVVTEFDKTPRKDMCLRHRILHEWYCDGNAAQSMIVMCKEGCKNSACLPETQN